MFWWRVPFLVLVLTLGLDNAAGSSGVGKQGIQYTCEKDLQATPKVKITIDSPQRKVVLFDDSSSNTKLSIPTTKDTKYVISSVTLDTVVQIGVFPKDGFVQKGLEGGKGFEIHKIKCTQGGSKGMMETVVLNITSIADNKKPTVDPTQFVHVDLTMKIKDKNDKQIDTVTIGEDASLVLQTEIGHTLKPVSCTAEGIGKTSGAAAKVSKVTLVKKDTGCPDHKNLLEKFEKDQQKGNIITAKLHPFRFKGFPSLKIECSVLVCTSPGTACNLPTTCTKRMKRSRSVGFVDNSGDEGMGRGVSVTVSVQDPGVHQSSSSTRVAYSTRFLAALFVIPVLFQLL